MISKSITAQTSKLISHHIFVNVMLNNSSNQKSLHAAVSYEAGDIICKFYADITQSFATYLTLQTGINKHITLLPDFLQYVNHSCEPNVFFNTITMELVCLLALQPGEEFVFFYPSTEWEMAEPFVCNCGYAGCLQLINGASHLSVDEISKYKLTEFIKQQLRFKLAM